MTDGPEELVGRPGRSLFGIVRLAEADGVLAELAARGFQGEVLQPHDADTWRAGLQGGGVIKQVRRLLDEDGIGKGLRYSEQRDDEAVIRVRAPSAKAAEPAADVLKAHGGYYVHYFGEWSTGLVGPESTATGLGPYGASSSPRGAARGRTACLRGGAS